MKDPRKLLFTLVLLVLLRETRANSVNCSLHFGNVSFAAAVASAFGLPRPTCTNCNQAIPLPEWRCGTTLCLSPQSIADSPNFKGLWSTSKPLWCILHFAQLNITGAVYTHQLVALPPRVAPTDPTLLLDLAWNAIDSIIGPPIPRLSVVQGLSLANNLRVLQSGPELLGNLTYVSLPNVSIASSVNLTVKDLAAVEALILDGSPSIAASLFERHSGTVGLSSCTLVSCERCDIAASVDELLLIVGRSGICQWLLDGNRITGCLRSSDVRNLASMMSLSENGISTIELSCLSSNSSGGAVDINVSRNPVTLVEFVSCDEPASAVEGVSSFTATELIGSETLALRGIANASSLLAVFAATVSVNFSNTALLFSGGDSSEFVIPSSFSRRNSPCPSNRPQCRAASFSNCSLSGHLILLGGEDSDWDVVDVSGNSFSSISEVCSGSSSTAFVALDSAECSILTGCCAQSIAPCQPCSGTTSPSSPTSIRIYATLLFIVAALALFVAFTVCLYRRFAMKRFRTVPLLADDVVENAVSLTKTGRDRWTESDEAMLANDETVCSHFFAQYIWHPRKLGHGSFSDVFLVTRKKDGVKFALKRNKCADNVTWDSLHSEYWLLHFAEHKNVVAIEEVFMLFADPFFLSAKDHVDQLSSSEFPVGDTTERFRDDLTRQTTQDDKFGPWLDDVPSERRLIDSASSSGLKMSFTSSAAFGRREQARCCYIIMEYVAGGDLHSFLAARKAGGDSKKGALSEVEALHIVVQLFDALRYLHDPSRREALMARATTNTNHFSSGNFSRSAAVASSGPILHGDIKPKNILLDLTGLRPKKNGASLGGFEQIRAVLTDFGGAGTERYVAPEAIHKLIPASDVFSAGCVAFELLCGSNASTIRSFHFACKQEKFAQKSREVLLSVGVQAETARFVTSRLMAYDHMARPSAEEAYKVLLGFYKSLLK